MACVIVCVRAHVLRAYVCKVLSAIPNLLASGVHFVLLPWWCVPALSGCKWCVPALSGGVNGVLLHCQGV